MKIKSLVIAVLLCWASGVWATKLIDNPGFEKRPLGWTFSSDPDAGVDVGVCTEPCVHAHSGQNAAYKNQHGGGKGTIGQKIATTKGTLYRIQVYVATTEGVEGHVNFRFGESTKVISIAEELEQEYKLFEITHKAVESSTLLEIGGDIMFGSVYFDSIAITELQG